MFHGEFKSNVAAVAAGNDVLVSARIAFSSLRDHVGGVTTVRPASIRPNGGSRSAGEGLCVLQSFLFTTQQEH